MILYCKYYKNAENLILVEYEVVNFLHQTVQHSLNPLINLKKPKSQIHGLRYG